MKASELRIGNLVKLEGISRHIKVSIIDTTETSTNTKYKPIPLTEEWFTRFGFNRCIFNDGNSIGFKIRTNKFELICIYWKVLPLPREHSFQVFAGTVNISEIEYVHQLQNLYFALTGEELTIKTEQQ